MAMSDEQVKELSLRRFKEYFSAFTEASRGQAQFPVKPSDSTELALYNRALFSAATMMVGIENTGIANNAYRYFGAIPPSNGITFLGKLDTYKDDKLSPNTAMFGTNGDSFTPTREELPNYYRALAFVAKVEKVLPLLADGTKLNVNTLKIEDFEIADIQTAYEARMQNENLGNPVKHDYSTPGAPGVLFGQRLSTGKELPLLSAERAEAIKATTDRTAADAAAAKAAADAAAANQPAPKLAAELNAIANGKLTFTVEGNNVRLTAQSSDWAAIRRDFPNLSNTILGADQQPVVFNPSDTNTTKTLEEYKATLRPTITAINSDNSRERLINIETGIRDRRFTQSVREDVVTAAQREFATYGNSPNTMEPLLAKTKGKPLAEQLQILAAEPGDRLPNSPAVLTAAVLTRADDLRRTLQAHANTPAFTVAPLEPQAREAIINAMPAKLEQVKAAADQAAAKAAADAAAATAAQQARDKARADLDNARTTIRTQQGQTTEQAQQEKDLAAGAAQRKAEAESGTPPKPSADEAAAKAAADQAAAAKQAELNRKAQAQFDYWGWSGKLEENVAQMRERFPDLKEDAKAPVTQQYIDAMDKTTAHYRGSYAYDLRRIGILKGQPNDPVDVQEFDKAVTQFKQIFIPNSKPDATWEGGKLGNYSAEVRNVSAWLTELKLLQGQDAQDPAKIAAAIKQFKQQNLGKSATEANADVFEDGFQDKFYAAVRQNRQEQRAADEQRQKAIRIASVREAAAKSPNKSVDMTAKAANKSQEQEQARVNAAVQIGLEFSAIEDPSKLPPKVKARFAAMGFDPEYSSSYRLDDWNDKGERVISDPKKLEAAAQAWQELHGLAPDAQFGTKTIAAMAGEAPQPPAAPAKGTGGKNPNSNASGATPTPAPATPAKPTPVKPANVPAATQSTGGGFHFFQSPEGVTALQTLLTKNGFKVAVDGKYGGETQKAVESASKQYGVNAKEIGKLLTALVKDTSHDLKYDQPVAPLPAAAAPSKGEKVIY